MKMKEYILQKWSWFYIYNRYRKMDRKKFGVKDVERMLQEEETKMINGKTKYYTMKEFENFANQVVYGE